MKPWVNSKAEADSLRIEVEMKNAQLAKLREKLNISQTVVEKVNHENDELVRKSQQAEETQVKVSLAKYSEASQHITA